MAKRVLVCPLDWGLGHATRCAGLINQLVDSGFEVIVGADKAPLHFLRQYFPRLPYILIPSKTIKYPKNGSLMPLKMLVSLPGILRSIAREHSLLKIVLKVNQIDVVISDNRFGLWNKSVYCIFITHQLQVIMPRGLRFLQQIISKINYWFIGKYNECWISDAEGKINLAGKLSHPHKVPANSFYIGTLSRFGNGFGKLDSGVSLIDFDILVLLSGPEPQRSILEKIILLQIDSLPGKCLFVQGKPEENAFAESPKLTLVSHLKSENLGFLIKSTPIVIARSGYSSIMDFVALKKHVILIPTPGQTEQEYLADYLMEKNWFYSVKQNGLNLAHAIESYKNFSFENFPELSGSLNERLTNLI